MFFFVSPAEERNNKQGHIITSKRNSFPALTFLIFLLYSLSMLHVYLLAKLVLQALHLLAWSSMAFFLSSNVFIPSWSENLAFILLGVFTSFWVDARGGRAKESCSVGRGSKRTRPSRILAMVASTLLVSTEGEARSTHHTHGKKRNQSKDSNTFKSVCHTPPPY